MARNGDRGDPLFAEGENTGQLRRVVHSENGIQMKKLVGIITIIGILIGIVVSVSPFFPKYAKAEDVTKSFEQVSVQMAEVKQTQDRTVHRIDKISRRADSAARDSKWNKKALYKYLKAKFGGYVPPPPDDDDEDEE